VRIVEPLSFTETCVLRTRGLLVASGTSLALAVADAHVALAVAERRKSGEAERRPASRFGRSRLRRRLLKPLRQYVRAAGFSSPLSPSSATEGNVGIATQGHEVPTTRSPRVRQEAHGSVSSRAHDSRRGRRQYDGGKVFLRPASNGTGSRGGGVRASRGRGRPQRLTMMVQNTSPSFTRPSGLRKRLEETSRRSAPKRSSLLIRVAPVCRGRRPKNRNPENAS